jgi:hypothetical protein
MISLGNAKIQFEIGTRIIAVQILSMEVCRSKAGEQLLLSPSQP